MDIENMADDEVAVEDNLHAPDFFADEVMAFSLVDGTVRLILTSSRWTQPPPGHPVRVVVGRLVMPVGAAQRLVVGLNDFLSRTGADPSQSLKAGEAVN